MGGSLSRRVVGVSLAVVLAAVAALGPASMRRAEAQDWYGVDAWVQVASTAPAAGCVVSTSVEVRDTAYGAVVPWVDVVATLFVDGATVAETWGVTDANGIAWLGVDTSGAYAGAVGWLDVTVGGAYAGGLNLYPTADGPCAGDGVLAHFATALPTTWGAGGADSAAQTGGAWLWVPTYVQQRNLSCEYAALTIATAAFGAAVSEWEFDWRVGWSANPHWGYRGNITGWWGNTWDYGVYAEALAPALAEFGFYGEVFYGQGDPGALTDRLDRGMPTLLWLGLWGDTSYYDYTDDGTPFKLAAGYHVVVAHGYDAGGVYVSDPATGIYDYYSWDYVLWTWSVLDGMSLAVAPY